MRGRWILWAPLGLLLVLGLLFAWGLTREPSAPVRSQIIGQPIPSMTLAAALPETTGFATAEPIGKPRLVNLFASWCVPCRAEAPQLEALARAGVHIDGVAIRDRPEDLARFIAETGNPYARVGGDPNSALMLAFGSAGVPETFIVDGRNIVVHQLQGAITPAMVPEILAQLERLQ